MARPAGIYGEIGWALLGAAYEGPGTARQLAYRSLVGLRQAHYTISRLVDRGVLIVVNDSYPAVYAMATEPAPESQVSNGQELASVLTAWGR